MGPHSTAAIALLAILPTAGCSLFGPRPPLPRRSYVTPKAALDTLVAAVASDDSRTIWESIGPDFKKRAGLGDLEWEIAWGRLKESIFGIHLLDRAQRSAPQVLPPAGGRTFPLVRFRLSLAGSVLDVWLRQYSYWEVITLLEEPGSVPEATSKFVPDISGILKVETVNDLGVIQLRTPGQDWTPMPSEVLSVRGTREWLVYHFSPPGAGGEPLPVDGTGPVRTAAVPGR